MPSKKDDATEKNTYPEPLPFVYSMSKPNEDLVLYQGPIEITQDKTLARGDGCVKLSWFPYPDVRFEVLSGKPPASIVIGPVQLNLLDRNVSFDGSVLRVGYFSGRDMLGGVIPRAVAGGDGEKLQKVMFHVLNLDDYLGHVIQRTGGGWRKGRLTLDLDKWKIDIDSSDTIGELLELVKSQGGYILTHAGCLQHSNGRTFSIKDAEHILTLLAHLLPFLRGIWTGPILPVGFNRRGEKCWEDWSSERNQPWLQTDSWFPTGAPEVASEVARGFESLFRHDLWNEPLKLAIHWYVHSNCQSGGIEGAIILTQSAFELLSWVRFVEADRSCSSDGFSKLPAADKIRLLVSQSGIPLEVPSELKELSKFAKEHNYDGPDAITNFRNSIVHYSKVKRGHISKLTPRMKWEVWNLSVWYLELILLRLCKYNGVYSNRLKAGRHKYFDVEPVPWKSDRTVISTASARLERSLAPSSA